MGLATGGESITSQSRLSEMFQIRPIARLTVHMPGHIRVTLMSQVSQQCCNVHSKQVMSLADECKNEQIVLLQTTRTASINGLWTSSEMRLINIFKTLYIIN